MTYQEIKDRLAKCEFSLKCIADGSYKSKSTAKLTETTKKLIVLKESLQKQLVEAEGTIRTADSEEAKKLADKGVNVDLVEPKDLETNEQEDSSFDQTETAKIAASVGKATVLALQGEGENISSARVKRIKPNTFDVHIGFKNDNENIYAFYIVGDTLYLKDSSYDREISDVGVQQSGEAIINVDVVKDQLQKYFKTVNTALGEAERTKKVGEMTDQEFTDAQEKDRLDNHPEKEMIKKIQYLIAKEKANKKEDSSQGAGTMEENSSQEDAASDLRDIVDQIEQLSDDAKETVRNYFPNELSRLEAYGVFDMIYSNNRYDITLGRFVDQIEDGDYDDLDDDDYPNEGNEEVEEGHGLDKGDVDFLQSLVDRMQRGKTWKAEEFKPLKRILQFIIKSNILQDKTRDLSVKEEKEVEYYPETFIDIATSYIKKRYDGRRLGKMKNSDLERLGHKIVDQKYDGDERLAYEELVDDKHLQIREEEASVGKLQKSHEMLVSKMKDLAKQYKKGDKSVIDLLKALGSKKKQLEKDIDDKVSGINKDQQLDPNVTEGRGDMDTIKGLIDDRANESGFEPREEAAEIIAGIAEEYKLDLKVIQNYMDSDGPVNPLADKDAPKLNEDDIVAITDKHYDYIRDIIDILKTGKIPQDIGFRKEAIKALASLLRDPGSIKEGTELYDEDGLHFKRFAPGKEHDGPALQITTRKLKGGGFDYIQIPGNKVKKFARAAVHVAQEFGDLTRQTTVNENVKKYRLGDMYSNDFDYIGMLKAGLKATLGSSVQKLKKLYSSFEDVNYHSENRYLGDLIDALKSGERIEAKESLLSFRKAINATLKDME